MDYWRHMPTNHFLCICIFKKKEGGCWGSVLICQQIGICVFVFVRKKRGKIEEVCWGSVLICRPICQSHSPGAIARNTSAHQRIQIQRATFPLQIQLGMQT